MPKPVSQSQARFFGAIAGKGTGAGLDRPPQGLHEGEGPGLAAWCAGQDASATLSGRCTEVISGRLENRSARRSPNLPKNVVCCLLGSLSPPARRRNGSA